MARINSDIYNSTSEDSIDPGNPFARAMKVASPIDAIEEEEDVKNNLMGHNSMEDEFANLNEIEEQ